MRVYDIESFAKLIDHTGLDNNKTDSYLETLCQEAIEYNFQMVAINSVQTAFCAERLKDHNINVGAAISFPSGQTSISVKVFEAKDAILQGANEIDYVLNISEVKNKNWDYIRNEMKEIVKLCQDYGVISKVIFENYLLTNDEIIELAKIAKDVKPNFVKTSTGKVKGGATVEDIILMKKILEDEVKIKASAQIRSFETTLQMLKAGAERIGCRESIKIMKEFKEYLKANNTSELIIN